MSLGYNSLRTKEENKYSKYKNEILECMYSFDFNRLNKLLEISELNYEGNLIFNTICNLFNVSSSKSLLNSELKKLKNIEEISKCNFSRNNLSFNFKNTNVKVKKIIKNPEEFTKNLNGVIEISKQLQKPNKIVIGYLTEELDKIQKLHFWIEYTKNNETYVVDYLNNIIINKEGYYLLTQPKIMNEINSDQINYDTVTLLNEIFKLEHDEILCFYQEFEKDLKKIK